MKKDIDVLFVYEHAQRELNSIALIAAQLELKGYTTAICQGPYLMLSKKQPYYNRVKVAVVLSLYSDYELLVTVNKLAGYVDHIVNLYWEQVINASDENWRRCIPKGCARYAYHVCWGELTKEALLAEGIQGKYLLEIGAPQNDFYAPLLYGIDEGRETLCLRYGIDTQKKLVLFLSSFAYAGLSKESKENLIISQGRERLNQTIERTEKSQKKILIWIKELLKNDEYCVIYRPHPSELKNETLSMFAKEQPNFKIIAEESARTWIKAVDAIVNWNSTLTIECLCTNKPFCIVRPIDIESCSESRVNKNIDKIRDCQSFLKWLDQNCGQKTFHKQYALLYNDEELATTKLTNVIVAMIKNKDTFNWRKAIKGYFGKYKRDFDKDEKYRMFCIRIYNLGSKHHLNLAFMNKYIILGQKYVARQEEVFTFLKEKEENRLVTEYEHMKDQLMLILQKRTFFNRNSV